MAQRRIVQTVLNADANRESQEAAERDRERRRKEASSADRIIKSNQQMLLSRSADIVLSLQHVFAKKCKRQRFDKLERRRGMHCFVSADEDFSRLFVEVVQQLLSLFVGDCDTTAFD
ncbi:pentatricopeptide repeat-containing protein-like [Dorcoceras hygrometricum]|uniref:Pentatricopeptide repeat-containing protein-like n=1 Tax=Dorcoceras hygrometricum TaxID=472368 RepID=A0A2Z6ZVM0_9LAMI|nr:pentatricopeptide repeat-containing protein-like [Dorcoceras hygrometricum]